MTRVSIRVFAIVLVLGTGSASAWCADDDFTNSMSLPGLTEPPAPPPAPTEVPQIATPAVIATQPCEGLTPAPACTPSPFEGDLCTRPLLLGNLCGVRDQLAAHGITFNVDTYQFYQGVTTGGIHDVWRVFRSQRLFHQYRRRKSRPLEGLLHHAARRNPLRRHVNFDTGAIIPVNTAELIPKASGSETALTGVKFTQALSENFVTFAGKLNMLDEFKMPFTGARPLDGFWNLGMSFPVVVARTVPDSTLGAGAAILQDGRRSLPSWSSIRTTRRPRADSTLFSITV